jgi:hydrogenase maturation protease
MAPVLVLGLGNLLLQDEAVGLRLLSELEEDSQWGEAVEFLDGGTRGLSLLGYIENRPALLILDAIGMGDPAGTVRVLRDAEIGLLRGGQASTAHEGNALQLLRSAELIGAAPARVTVVGIAPAQMHTSIGLTEIVEAAVPAAVKVAAEELRLLLTNLQQPQPPQ